MNNVERVGRHLVRSLFDPLPTNDHDAPIWCLGQRYPARPKRPAPDSPAAASPSPAPPSSSHGTPPASAAAAATAADDDDSWIRTSLDEPGRPAPSQANGVARPRDAPDDYGGWPRAFLDDFESRIWMTYRSGFAAMPKSADPRAASAMSLRVRLQTLHQAGFTSDAGFGCMIRSGQCILANALASLRLGRGWRRGDSATALAERELLALFADDARAPFSIHRFVQHGAAVCAKFPGEWFGPAATARCIQDLVHAHAPAGLKVYVTGDGADVYEDDLMQLAKGGAGGDDDTFTPTLVLVGTRLGIDKITPAYWDALKAALRMPQSMGIAGGRPSASHYFVGTQSSHFFYLDPHDTRRLLPYHADAAAYSADDVDSCHTRRLRRLDVRDMDPSMLLAFVVRDEADWAAWRAALAEAAASAPPKAKAVVHVARSAAPREGAVDEVESFDDPDDEGDGELV